MIKLNLGCGHIQPTGWVNVDGSIRAWVASRLGPLDNLLVRLRLWPPTEFNRQTRWLNLLKPLPWPDQAVDAIYLGEVLEHFTREDGKHVLAECHRVLKPGGALRVRVPDNARFWRNYLAEYDPIAAEPPSEWKNDHTRWVEMYFRDICTRRRWFGSYGHFHKWMYDDVSLVLAFRDAGFADARRRDYRDSAIDDVDRVEVRDDLIVEGTKPKTAAGRSAESAPRPLSSAV
jgi:predicted SAM-dependent methyltransferase